MKHFNILNGNLRPVVEVCSCGWGSGFFLRNLDILLAGGGGEQGGWCSNKIEPVISVLKLPYSIFNPIPEFFLENLKRSAGIG